MLTKVADIRANLNENILYAVTIIGKSEDRRKVFEAIYRGKKQVKTVDDIVEMTGLTRIRVLQEAGKLNQIVEKTKKDNQTAYRKDETYTHHKNKILSILDDPKKAKKYPTKQSPRVTTTTYKIIVPGKKPKIKPVTVDDIDSFDRVRRVTKIDSSLRLDKMAEIKLKTGLQKIIGETHTPKDWGGEKNDLYTSKIKYKGKRRAAAFALKGKGTKGTLTPKKMGKNGDQIARLVGSAAEIFFVVYHGKIDESITFQLQAFVLAKSMSGATIYYGIIDGDDLNRLYQAYKTSFSKG
ncbi:MAG: hypothetical protein MUP17_10175 [candidate division Zixibacteria bacterium]|nr:hypothetical protein [candidate division Zixibacteria bacterium]